LKEDLIEMKIDYVRKYLVKLRPYYEKFFETIAPIFEIYIYTKASHSYAKFLLEEMNYRLGEKKIKF